MLRAISIEGRQTTVPHVPPFEENDALFRVLIATALDGIVVFDAEGLVRVYNPACERLFGYAPQEVIGRSVKMLMPAVDGAKPDGFLPRCCAPGRSRAAGISREVIGQRKDLSTFDMYVCIGEGLLDGTRIFVGTIHDLTELKNETSHREDANRLLAQIVQASHDAIISKTPQGIVTSWNAGAERIFGYKADEMIGKDISLIIPLDRRVEEAHILALLREGHTIEHYETVRLHKNGTEVLASISVAPIRDGDGHIVGATKIARDITEKKRTAAQTQRMQNEFAHVARLSTMSQTSAAIAHELNQPLTAITNYVQAALQMLKPDAPTDRQIETARAAVEKAGEQTKRAAAIIRYLREFAEKRESKRQLEDLNRVIREAVDLVFVGGVDSKLKINLDLAADIPPVEIDKIQIQQVLMNLIRNSVEAMAEIKHPTISVSSGREEKDTDFAFVIVRDIGPGLSPKIAGRLFKPFVTTKDHGMGIGLNICQSIMESHGGYIHVLKDDGSGTGFCFRLRLAQPVEIDCNQLAR